MLYVFEFVYYAPRLVKMQGSDNEAQPISMLLSRSFPHLTAHDLCTLECRAVYPIRVL